MSGKQVLLFRSKPDDASTEDIYEKLLQEENSQVKTISPIQFHFINEDLLSTKLQATNYDALIFTSKRAVEAVQRVLTDNDQRSYQRIYVEGPATGTLVKEIFGSSMTVLGEQCGGAEALADFIVQDVKNLQKSMKLFFPCAQARLDALPKRLSNESNIDFDELIVYETIPSESLDQELKDYLQKHGKPNVLGFFSPSGFDSVVKASERIGFDLTSNKIVLISLGKTTSAAIRTRFQSISFDERMCAKPTAEDFVRLVKNLD